MTRADRVLIVAIAVAALAAWPVAAAMAGGHGGEVVITGPAGSTTASLSADATLNIEGIHGTVVVRISDGNVRVVDSKCPDHVCVKTGAVSTAGSVIACVPNGVVLRVSGGDGDGLDARVR